MSTLREDWDKAREVVEPVIDEAARKARDAGIDPTGIVFGGALVVAGANLINENAGPDTAVRLLENLIEGLRG